jgi:replicative DNA helicase
MTEDSVKAESKSTPYTDIQLETTLLSMMIEGKASASYFLDRIQSTDLYYNEYRTVFSGIKDLFALGSGICYMTMRSKFAGEHKILTLLERLNDHKGVVNIDKLQVCRLVKQFSQKRVIKRACGKAISRIENNDNSDDVVQDLQKEATDIIRASEFIVEGSLSSDTNEWVSEIEEEFGLGEREEDTYDGPAVGMSALDRKMRGLQDINVISAPTGIGKSMLALNWIVNIATDNRFEGRILYINYEMNKKQLARRIFAIRSGVTYNEIYDRRFLTRANADRYNAARIEFLERKNIILTGNEPKTLPVTIAMIQEHVSCHNVEVVVIDHLGEISAERSEHKMEHWMKLQKYVKELKGVTSRLGVRLIVVAQQNREGYNSGNGSAGGLGRVAGTLDLSRICDCFINLYTNRNGEKIMALEKNRNGEVGEFIVDFNGPTQTMTIKQEVLG